MNLSAKLLILEPPGAVTVTSTVPAYPTGEVAMISVVLSTVKLDASEEPKLTAVVPMKPFPIIMTEVLPVVGPEEGLMLVTTGAPKVN